MLLLSSILALVAAKTKRKFFFKNWTRDTRTAQAICRSKNWTGSDLTVRFLPSHHARLEQFTKSPVRVLNLKLPYKSHNKAQRASPSYKKDDYSKIFYVLKDRNSIARNRQFYNLVNNYYSVELYGRPSKMNGRIISDHF